MYQPRPDPRHRRRPHARRWGNVAAVVLLALALPLLLWALSHPLVAAVGLVTVPVGTLLVRGVGRWMRDRPHHGDRLRAVAAAVVLRRLSGSD